MATPQEKSVELRMRLARDKMQLARKLVDDRYFNDAISKAYYAMFYASKAILLSLGEDPHKHKGVVSLYGKKVARVGLSDPKYGRVLASMERLRIDADYNEQYFATEAEARNAVLDAEDFVNQAQETLKKIQTRGE